MKIYVVTKKEVKIDDSCGYHESHAWFDTLSVFDSREKALDFMKVYAIRFSNGFIKHTLGDYKFTEWKDGPGDELANRIVYDYLTCREGYDEMQFELIMEEKELR